MTGLRRPSGRKPSRRAARRLRLLALAAILSLSALTIGALSAEAHHTNPLCAPGSYTQVWNDTTFSGIAFFTDECIFVRGNITVQSGADVHFRDSEVTFANNEPDVGNLTVTLENNSVWEMLDGDSDPSTFLDRSGLYANDSNNVSFGFFFNVSVNASLYLNDTIVRGGGLPGPGLTWRTGFYLEGLNDFAWNRVDHSFLANGLMLVNFAKPKIMRDPGFTSFGAQAGWGLYLSNVGNLTIESLTVQRLPFGVLINDSRNITINWFNSTATNIGLIANRVTTMRMQDVQVLSARTMGMDFNTVTNLTILRARVVPQLSNNSVYGIEMEGSKDILMRDIEIANHATADLHIWQGTQNLLAQNVTLRGSTTQASSHGIWAVEAADIFRPSNFTFISLNVSSRAEGINLTGVGKASFLGVNISATVVFGLYTVDCFDVLLRDGGLLGSAGSPGIGAYLGGSNLTIQRFAVRNYFGPGVVVGDASFTIESVTFQSNDRSIRSWGTQMIGPSFILNSTIPAGASADAVNLTGYDPSSFTRLFVYGNNFTNPCSGGINCYGLRIDAFWRVDVIGNTFFALPIAVTRSGTLSMSANTHRVSQLPLNAVVILFDNGTTLEVNGDVFQTPTAPAGISTVIRAQFVMASVAVADMRLPPADFGLWFSANPASSLLTTVDVHNITASARRDAVTSFIFNTVAIDNVTVDASVNGILIFGGGNAQDVSVRDCYLGATGTAINLTLDSAGRAVVTDIGLNNTPSPAGRALSIKGGSVATVVRLTLDRVTSGIVTSDLRRLVLGQQNFTNNSVGLRMDVTSPSVTSVDLNWTASFATRIENTFMRFGGEVTVVNSPFTLRNATLSLFALASDPRPTRFFFQGCSALSITDGSSITTENQTANIANSEFTLQFSPCTTLTLSSQAPWPRVLLEGLGDPDSPFVAEQGIYLQAQGVTVTNVTFVTFTRALIGLGVNITVSNCSFIGGVGTEAAVRVTSGAARMSFVTVVSANGIEAIGSSAMIDNSSFRLGAFVLSLTNSQGWLTDATVEQTSTVVIAGAASTADLRGVDVTTALATAFSADGGSAITIENSRIDDVQNTLDADGTAKNGGRITFVNSFINRFDQTGHLYKFETRGGGTVDVFWSVRFAVCVLSSYENQTGAQVDIYGSSGSIVFSEATGGNGYTAVWNFLEYHSEDGVEEYTTPLQVDGSVGTLVNSTRIFYRDEALVQVCVDDVPPVITFTTFLGDPYPGEEFEFRVQVTDDESGLAQGSPCYAFSGDPGQPCVPRGGLAGRHSVSFNVTKTLVEGFNWFRVEAEDLFGNRAVKWQNTTRDTVGPSIVACQPPFTTRTGVPSVDLICTVEGGAVNATFQSLIPQSWFIDANGSLHANFILKEGTNFFTVSVIDDLGWYKSQTFAWTLDTTIPTCTIGTDPTRIVTKQQVVINGTCPIDTVSLTIDGRPINRTGTQFSFLQPLTQDGQTTVTIEAVDAVGNVWTRPLTFTRDMTTNCSITTPARGAQLGETPVLVSGHCDPDVSIFVNGDQAVSVGRDGLWSVRISLVDGPNKITVSGTDVYGASWYDEVQVYYAPGSGPTGSGVLLVFAILAIGTLVAAFYISRRPRHEEEEPVYRTSTGAQKAPPRPKPQTLKLPETPDDLTYRPKPPAPPPPPPPRGPGG